jgi:putative glutamine amidotransferase
VNSPNILITVDLKELGESSRLSHVVPDGYVEGVEQAGGIPIVLPVLSNASMLQRHLDLADGVLLVGGTDYRTENRHRACNYVATRRERHDFELLAALLARDMAVLGICLGMQLISLGTGGSLYEDTRSQRAGSSAHNTVDHEVIFESPSKLATLYGERVVVNSSHHQSVKEAGKGMRVVGRAPDGVIEAIEGDSDRFLVGVQWHPERMLHDERQLRLWQMFISAAAAGGCWTSICNKPPVA